MNPILVPVQQYLETLEPHTKDPELLASYWSAYMADIQRVTKNALGEIESREFRYRLSAMGRPLCQLQLHKQGAGCTPESWTDKQRWLQGHIVEAYAKLVLRMAGVKIVQEGCKAALQVSNGATIPGEADLILNLFGEDLLWDVKGVSDTSYNGKFRDYTSLKNKDDFGYVEQLYGYAEALSVKPGGWIVINKQSGEWRVIEVPANWKTEQLTALITIASNYHDLESGAPLKRQFQPTEEKFYGKATGNMVLSGPCYWCEYKFSCHPEVQELPQIPSKAFDPKTMYYTQIKEAA